MNLEKRNLNHTSGDLVLFLNDLNINAKDNTDNKDDIGKPLDIYIKGFANEKLHQ